MRQLSAKIKEFKNKPFVWGETDCCMFTSDCINVQTGIDPANKYRGKYSTEMGAKRALKKYGSIEDTLDEHFDRVEYNLAKRGDVVLFDSALGTTLGVKWSGGVLSMSENGVTLVSNFTPDVTWKITK